jgi:hypothetical protein
MLHPSAPIACKPRLTYLGLPVLEHPYLYLFTNATNDGFLSELQLILGELSLAFELPSCTCYSFLDPIHPHLK